jgi:hypothetical protein
VRVEVIVLPEDSSLTLDGNSIKAGRMFLPKGKHQFKATRQDFEDVTVAVDTATLDAKQPIYVMPNPVSDKALQWLAEHPDVQAEREAGGGAEAQAVGNQLIDNYPFIGLLPHETSNFIVGYGLSEDNKLSLQVTLMPYALKSDSIYKQQLFDIKQDALRWMSDNGIDPSKYNTTYTPDVP